MAIERVLVYGISAGGLTAIELAANYPKRVKKLVLASATSRKWLNRNDKIYKTAAKPGYNRLKKNIEEFTDGLETLEKIHPVTFRYNGKAGMPTDKQYVGVIAQEMQKVAPYTVGEFI